MTWWPRWQVEPVAFHLSFTFRGLRPVCDWRDREDGPICGRGPGRYGALYTCEVVGEPVDGELRARCKRHYDNLPYFRKRLHKPNLGGIDESDDRANRSLHESRGP